MAARFFMAPSRSVVRLAARVIRVSIGSRAPEALSIRCRNGYVIRMRSDVDDLRDLELRLVDPAKNRFRIYGLTECRTLFGELCLRIVWGRIGNRRLRERSEVFEDRVALLRRRQELLGRLQRHGYVPTAAPRKAAHWSTDQDSPNAHAIEREIVEAHGLPLGDPTARELVTRWHAATLAIVGYLKARGTEALDLIDASTLAGMFVNAGAA